MNRRNALKAAGLLAAGTAIAPRLLSANSSRRYRIGACDWSIGRMLELDAYRMGQHLGLDGIEASFDEVGRGWDLRTAENRADVRKVVKSTGVGISSLAIGLLNRVPLAKTDRGEEIVRECIETMVTMREEADQLEDRELAAKVAPDVVLLAFFGRGKLDGDRALLDSAAEKLKRLAPLAEEQGITLGLETTLSEADHRYIMDKVGSPAVKVYYDVANSENNGYDIYAELESLGSENLCQIHCKERGYLLGKGKVDFDRVADILQRIDYDGWLVIESAVPKGMDVRKAYEHNVAYLHSEFG